MKLTEQKLKEMIRQELEEMMPPQEFHHAMAKGIAANIERQRKKEPSIAELDAEIRQLEKMLADARKMKAQLQKIKK